MADDSMPRALRSLWGAEESGRRGPKPAMSVRAIAAAGVAIADAEGLGAASMAAVAKRLGYTTMSLYRYVDSKADLQAAMVDEALGPPYEVNRRRGWRAQLTGWAEAELSQLSAHPWVLDVRVGSPPVGPHMVGWMDVGLGILARAGLTPQQAASALLFVDGYVRNQVMMGLQYADGGVGWAEKVRAVLDPETMPWLADALATGVFDDDPSDFPAGEFAFGLDLLLDGVARLASRAR